MQVFWIVVADRADACRLAVRGSALLGGGRTDAARAALGWLFFKVGSMNELQYRANFFIQVLQSAVAVGHGDRRARPRLLAYDGAERVDESELLVVMGVQILLGGVIRTIDPAEHAAADGGGARRQARLRADQAGGLAGARQRPRRADLAGGRRDLGGVVLGVRRRRARPRRRRSATCALPAMLVVGAVTIYCFWLRDRDARVLDRHGGRSSSSSTASTRPVAGRCDLPGLAADRRHVHRARSRSRSPCPPRR